MRRPSATASSLARLTSGEIGFFLVGNDGEARFALAASTADGWSSLHGELRQPHLG